MGYIYKITNKINNKIYIGQTIQKPSNRWYHHLCDAHLGSDLKFHRALRKYGREHFKLEVLEEVDDCLLNEREIYWINYFDSFHNGYNSTTGGDNPPRNDIRVICLETNVIYPSSAEAGRCLGINQVHIAECSRRAPKRATAGGYHWMHYEDYIQNGPIYRKLGNELNSKSVVCIETGIIYNSILEASKATGVARAVIRRNCEGLAKRPEKYHWRYNDNK